MIRTLSNKHYIKGVKSLIRQNQRCCTNVAVPHLQGSSSYMRSIETSMSQRLHGNRFHSGSSIHHIQEKHPELSKYITDYKKSLAYLEPNIARDLHPLLNPFHANEISIDYPYPVYWQCPQVSEHYWKDTIKNYINYTKRYNQPPKCTLCDQNEKRYNVQFYRVFPDLVPFWDYESNNHNTPENVFIKNNFMVWLKCPNNPNHRWFIRLPPNELSSPQYEAKCPYCQPQTKNNTYNQRKELLKWFHPTLNRFENFDIFKADLAAYNQYYWFQCPKDSTHVWKSSIATMAKRLSCPCCLDHVVCPTNNLSYRYPSLINYYNPLYNNYIPPELALGIKSKSYYWSCLYSNYTWKMSIEKMLFYVHQNLNPCPHCNHRPLFSNKKINIPSPLLSAGQEEGIPIDYITPFIDTSKKGLTGMYKPYYHASIRPKAKALSSPSSVHSSESQKKKEQKRVSELPNSAPEEAKNKKSNKENSNSNQEVYIEFF